MSDRWRVGEMRVLGMRHPWGMLTLITSIAAIAGVLVLLTAGGLWPVIAFAILFGAMTMFFFPSWMPMGILPSAPTRKDAPSRRGRPR